MKYVFKNYNKNFNITNIDKCHINILNVEYYSIIDTFPIFKANNFDKFVIVKISSGRNIILFGDKLLEVLDIKQINCLIWYMLINMSFGMYEYRYDIQRDMVVDTYVANICGYNNYIDTLNFIKEHSTDEHLDIIRARLRNIESLLVKNKQINVDRDKIIKNANLAFIEITDEENGNEEGC